MLKRFTFFVVLIGTLLYCFSPAFAGYFAIGGGKNAEVYNLSLEAGTTDLELGNHNYLFGIGIPFILHGDGDIPDGTIKSPISHDKYVSLDKKNDGTELGLFAKFGVELGHSGFYLSLLGGFSRANEIELVRSTETEQYFEQSSEGKTYSLYGGSIGYFSDIFNREICILVDYDNRRGVTGTIGFHW